MSMVSIIVPAYNESKNLEYFYREVNSVLNKIPNLTYEIIFVNDGSKDNSRNVLKNLSNQNSKIKYLDFTKNFGKEIATTAGLNFCHGDAAITIDADLQHPLYLIPKFIKYWQKGSKVVIGVRNKSKSDKISKKIGSWLFYKILNNISETTMVQGSTDYRLLDRQVIDEFNKLREKNRITRGLIDWLGFEKKYVYFDAEDRREGRPGYSFVKLVRLAFSSFVSLSLFPLKIAGYLGIFITIGSGLMGVYMFISNYVLKMQNFSGPAILAIINLFLIGIVLSCLGLIALYIANINFQVINRPLYIINQKKL